MVVNAFFPNFDISERSQVHDITIIFSDSYVFQQFPKYSPSEYSQYSFLIMFLDICERYNILFMKGIHPTILLF